MSEEKKVEVGTEETLAIGRLFQTMAADRKLRPKVLGLIKEAAPGTIIPELDVADEVDHRVTERVKPYEDANKTLTDRVVSLEARLGRDALRDHYGLDEAELVEVETLAKEAGIGKAETAVEFWRQKQTLGVPRGTSRGTGMADEDRTALAKAANAGIGALKALTFKHADRVIREIRGGRR